MNLDLRQFESFPAEFTAEVEADSREYEIEGVEFKDVMNVKIDIQKTREEYLCHGFVSVSIEEECSRCLNPFEEELSGEFSFIAKAMEEESGPNADELDIIYYKNNEPVVELNKLIRETLLLALPLKPLCSEDCKGLCPDCGVNLNEENCDCRHEEYDERWEGLKDLLG
jgi:uncharacterized protein